MPVFRLCVAVKHIPNIGLAVVSRLKREPSCKVDAIFNVVDETHIALLNFGGWKPLADGTEPPLFL